MSETNFNRLKSESSSYLKQHQDNPVHWWSYGPDAIQKAKDENKPIFLSIGYSSCHWCHVMNQESFQDQETADLLNQHFISIKVDREEHPDIDQYYQQACQLFVQTGGWPLSAFLLPDMRPFFVGTYYPKKKQGEGANFKELLEELNRVFHNDKDKVEENATQVTESIKSGLIPNEKIDFPNHFPVPEAIMEAIKEFADKENGGYGSAPKFPHFSFYEWAIEQMLEGMISKESGEHIINSLENMLMGGLIDHSRGGVHRYSVDEKFLVPHFEKMLYDQAGLLKLLSKASLLYPSPLLYDTLINTLDYLALEMSSDEEYFFSAQDADSEGHEGLYFTYTEEEFEDIINKAAGEDSSIEDKKDQIKNWFQITKEGNFEHQLNVISLDTKLKDEILTPESWEIIRKVRKELLLSRKKRIPPATDNKGVASWNFMLLSALADVIQYVRIDVIKKQALDLFNKCLEGSLKTFLKDQGDKKMRLRHTTTSPVHTLLLEDYVAFADAQMRFYEITGNSVFKKNLSDVLEFILKEFQSDNKLTTRAATESDYHLYPNQEVTAFDHSHQSSASTLISLIRRARMLFLDKELGSSLNTLHETYKNQALRNPLSAGEALRASTYPDDAYRLVKLPASWLQKEEYINFFNYFLPRFVLDYHQDDEENWQICQYEQCELQGSGLQSFIETLRPPKSDEGPSS